MTEQPEQTDREAAADCIPYATPAFRANIIAGNLDDNDTVQAITRARRLGIEQGKRMAGGEVDAVRYRWLRDKSCPPHQFYISVPDEFDGVRFSPHEVDAYIDAAIAALTEQQEEG